MIPRGKFFTILTIIVACAVLAWSCASSSTTASKDETAPKTPGPGVFIAVVAVVALVVAVVLMMPSGNESAPDKTPQEPLRDDVPPIRNTAIKVVINVHFNYSTKLAEDEARRGEVERILDRLNENGKADGNTFSFPNGEPSNFTLDFSFSDVGQPGNERFTGSVVLSGWGWGYIHTFDSGQYPYSDEMKITHDLTDKVYSYIHTGWHDSRKDAQ